MVLSHSILLRQIFFMSLPANYHKRLLIVWNEIGTDIAKSNSWWLQLSHRKFVDDSSSYVA